MKYTYRQGGNVSGNYPMMVCSEKSNCLSAFISALITVIMGVVMFFIVYYGWQYFIRPLLQAWSNMLVLGG